MAIKGVHVLLYTSEAEQLRATLRDALGWDDYVDAHGGWLIFALPPAELAVHPSGGETKHQLTLMCDDLDETIAELNADDSIDGVLVQSPLPRGLDEAAAILAVDPAKDVDGFHPVNAGLLYLGRPGLVPATPLGIMRLLDEYRVPIAGRRAVV